MSVFEVGSLCGLPLEDAKALLGKNGLEYEVTQYASLRGETGSDVRVVRAKKSGDIVMLTVSSFKTEIKKV